MMSDVFSFSYMVLSVLKLLVFIPFFPLGVGDLNITVPVKVTLADKAKFWRERIGRSFHLAVTNTVCLTLTL